MRWSTYLSPADGTEHAGLLLDGEIHGLRGHTSLMELIGDGESAWPPPVRRR
jgi:hypothetical protein